MPAAEAKEIGLIGHVVPDGQALDKAREIAEQIAANGPLAVQAVLRSLREAAEMTEADALAHELELGWPIFATNDAKEGATAFAEKRPATSRASSAPARLRRGHRRATGSASRTGASEVGGLEGDEAGVQVGPRHGGRGRWPG